MAIAIGKLLGFACMHRPYEFNKRTGEKLYSTGDICGHYVANVNGKPAQVDANGDPICLTHARFPQRILPKPEPKGKRWDMCRYRMCFRPTASGQKESDRRNRVCRFHTEKQVAANTKRIAYMQTKRRCPAWDWGTCGGEGQRETVSTIQVIRLTCKSKRSCVDLARVIHSGKRSVYLLGRWRCLERPVKSRRALFEDVVNDCVVCGVQGQGQLCEDCS